MQYLALYRKYRPDNFDDVVGQDKVVKVIKHAIESNRISHAYLFSGPRGTGKTTTAKIIARMVNCTNLIDGKPCGVCECCKNIFSNNDVVEIDAASNNGVDEIRELRDKVNLVPTLAKYKVYIIDEVHMLTVQAFNALLKTLEEPPSHVIFILATTEPHKIPLTIASRCQKFQFSKVSDDQIVDRLKTIVKNENVMITDDALYEIARLSDGGMRDAINFLDQLISYKDSEITIDDVYQVNGSVSYDDIYRFVIDINNGNRPEIINVIEEIDHTGKSITKFIDEVIIFLKDTLIYINTNKLSEISSKNDKLRELASIMKQNSIYTLIMTLNDIINKIKISNYPAIVVVVSILEFIDNNIVDNVNHKNENINNNGNEKKNNSTDVSTVELKDNSSNNIETVSSSTMDVDNSNIQENTVIRTNNNVIDENIKQIRINNTFVDASKQMLLDVKGKWNLLSNYLLSSKYSIVSGLLNDTIPVAAGTRNLILLGKYDSIVERVNEVTDVVSSLLKEMINKDYIIVCLNNNEWENEKKKYIDNLKRSKKYNYIDEEVKEDANTKIRTAVDDLIDMVGSDIIEFEN